MSTRHASALGGLAGVFPDARPSDGVDGATTQNPTRTPRAARATALPAGDEAPDQRSDTDSTSTARDAHAHRSGLTGIIATRLHGVREKVVARRGGSGPQDADPDADAVAGRVYGPTRQLWITRSLQAAIVIALLCGPVALFVGGGSSTPTRVAATPQTVITDISPQLTATDLADDCVPAWLRATQTTQASLSRCFDMGDGGATSLPENAIYDASDARASAVHRVLPSPAGSMLYSVTVSVAVRPAGSAQAPTRRYYRLPVIVAQSSVRALALPAQVPAPPTSLTTQLGYQYQTASNSAIVTAGAGFLTAMLTGTGDITRFTSPGTHLSAITPAPITSLTVTGARSLTSVTPQDDTPADGQRNRLLLTLSERPVGAPSGDTLTANYALSMTARAGRWEVTAIDLAPPTTSVSGGQSDTALGDDQAIGNPLATPDTDVPGATGTGSASDSATATAPAPTDNTPATASAGPTTPTTPAQGPSAAPGLLAPGGSDLGPR